MRLSNMEEGLTGRNPMEYKRTLAKPRTRSPCFTPSAGAAGKWHGALPYYKALRQFACLLGFSPFVLSYDPVLLITSFFPSIIIPFLLASSLYLQTFKLTMRSPTIAVLLALLASASASPLAHVSSRFQSSNLASSLLPRQQNDTTIPPGTADIVITGEILPIECIAQGRAKYYTKINIDAVIRFFTNDLANKIPQGLDFAAFNQQLPTTASAGISPDLPVTYAPGCDPAKPIYWAPLSGVYTDNTDIVVMNLEGGVRRAGYCGVMTRAAEGREMNYQSCFPQQQGT